MLALTDVPEATSQWQASPGTPYLFRTWRGRLWRKELNPAFYGGYQIKYVSLTNARLVAEWLGAV